MVPFPVQFNNHVHLAPTKDVRSGTNGLFSIKGFKATRYAASASRKWVQVPGRTLRIDYGSGGNNMQGDALRQKLEVYRVERNLVDDGTESYKTY